MPLKDMKLLDFDILTLLKDRKLLKDLIKN